MKSKIVFYSIVYRINCCDYDKFYIGKTKRQFVLRLVEHRKDKSSGVTKHMTDENHTIDWENFQIIDSSRDDRRDVTHKKSQTRTKYTKEIIQDFSNFRFDLLRMV